MFFIKFFRCSYFLFICIKIPHVEIPKEYELNIFPRRVFCKNIVMIDNQNPTVVAYLKSKGKNIISAYKKN